MTYLIPILAAFLAAGLTQLANKRSQDSRIKALVQEAAEEILGQCAEDNRKLRAKIVELELANQRLLAQYEQVSSELAAMKASLTKATPALRSQKGK